MQNPNSTNFRIGGDDETVETYSKPPPQAIPDRKRLEQLRKRVAAMMILLPCLVIGLLGFGYYEMNRRFEALHQSRLTELQTQAQTLENRFAELTAQYDTLRQTLSEKEQPLTEAFLVFERTSASLKEAVDALKTRIAGVEVEKADSEAVKEALAKALADFQAETTRRQEADMQQLRESMAEIQTATEKAREDAIAAAEKAAAEVALTFEPFQADMAKLNQEMDQVKKDVVDVLGDTVTLKKLNDGLKTLETRFKGETDTLARRANQNAKTIDTLSRQIRELENRLLYLEKRGGGKSGGGIIEQDIN